jgi:hypothetical protein
LLAGPVSMPLALELTYYCTRQQVPVSIPPVVRYAVKPRLIYHDGSSEETEHFTLWVEENRASTQCKTIVRLFLPVDRFALTSNDAQNWSPAGLKGWIDFDLITCV